MADAIGRVAWLVGAQVKREVEGLDWHSNQRPDLQIVGTFRPSSTALFSIANLIGRYVAHAVSGCRSRRRSLSTRHAGAIFGP